MERDAKQPILGRSALWVSDLNLSKSYWILLLTNFGIYDEENEFIQKLLNKAERSTSLIPNPFQSLKKNRLEVTLDFFMWLYNEDAELCFDILKYIYDDYKDKDEAPEPYAYVDELEDLKDGDAPEVNLDEIVPATPKAFESGTELEVYQQIKNNLSQVDEEIFIIDAYANEEVIWYLKDTSEDVGKRILTQGKKEELSRAAEKLVSNSNHRIEVRRNADCHDRLIFVDDQCFVLGDSIHAAGTKPVYAVKFSATKRFRQPWEQMWVESEEFAVFED